MTKGEILISSVAGKTFITENQLMENKDFVIEAKRLIKQGTYTMDQLINELVSFFFRCESEKKIRKEKILKKNKKHAMMLFYYFYYYCYYLYMYIHSIYIHIFENNNYEINK